MSNGNFPNDTFHYDYDVPPYELDNDPPIIDGFFYDIDAPSANAIDLLTQNIYRTQSSRDSLLYQQFSQTPLMPSQLYELANQPYGQAVVQELDKRVHQTAEKTGLPEQKMNTILHEIHVEAEKRFTSNDLAGKRLLEYFATRDANLSAGEAQLLWRSRTGDANIAETGELLLRYPIIGSIEGMKHTAPLDIGEVSNSEIFINQQLDNFKGYISQPSRIGIVEFEKQDERRDKRSLGWTNITYVPGQFPEMICGIKENLAEVTDGITTIELVKKQTYILLSPNLELKHVIPNIRLFPHPEKEKRLEANVQPIATTAYWRVKQPEV